MNDFNNMNESSTTISSLFFMSEFKKEVLTWITETLVIIMFLMLSYLTGRKLPKTLTRFTKRQDRQRDVELGIDN